MFAGELISRVIESSGQKFAIHSGCSTHGLGLLFRFYLDVLPDSFGLAPIQFCPNAYKIMSRICAFARGIKVIGDPSIFIQVYYLEAYPRNKKFLLFHFVL